MFIIYFTLAIIISTIFALQEIQIEGKHGWAEKLPTWKIHPYWFKYIPGGDKPLTGYHLYTWILHFLYPHTIFIFQPWSLKIELLIISFIILVLRLEDFLWFILNPHFGIKKFKKEFIPWHHSWTFSLPTPYWTSFVIWIFILTVFLNY